MIGDLGDLVARMTQQARQASAARAAADQQRRQRREVDDSYVVGGTNWDGYSLKSLQRMVGDQANPAQLDMLATEWARYGDKVAQASRDLSRSLAKLMPYWSGAASEDAKRVVVGNAAWISQLGGTAKSMADPIQDAGGALRSAQSTMPGGSPSSPFLASAGGGAAAGFAVGGPIGAAFGAALGGMASAFGFGSNKKKMKRKAVQTMSRFETAVMGIDGTTPRFGTPADGVHPGPAPVVPRPPQVTPPGPGVTLPPGPAHPPHLPGTQPPPHYPGAPSQGTTPSFTPGVDKGWDQHWRDITNNGHNNRVPLPSGPGANGIGGTGPFGPGGPVGGPFGNGRPIGGPGSGRLGSGPSGGRGGPFGAPGANGRGADGSRTRGGAGRGVGAGSGGLGGAPGSGAGRGGRNGTRGASRFGRANAFGADPHGRNNNGYGMPPGARDKEEDDEYRRRVPIEEDPFTTADLTAAPPVIGL
ncbi:PPE domain-containing protein [Actinokineospora auranticolor]|uniref:PPE family protein n=1 Tax=Actinokineospora auranticolor TaxID=155976 RepID=A0A2S6GXY3_9PSEU|nr:PPE domain-containing protein [Actinokineospora auranticolor]PPK70094.1 PPE family protein [Actinokineospora auranticolor]